MTLSVEPADPPEARLAEPAPRLPTSPWRPLLLRLHFYAGVLVAPFVAVAALTGLGYAFSPQLDSLVYGDQLHAAAGGREALPLQRQVDAARAAHPEGEIASIITAAPGRTTRVEIALPELGEKMRTVYVDPYTAEVRGDLVTWFGSTPLQTTLDDLHRGLLLGETGENYSELAASWLWVVALGGLLLWWQRLRMRTRDRRGLLRRATTADLRARGVRRTRSWHAATGVWLIVGVLFLSATGLTWSKYAGAHFSEVLAALDASRPELDATLPGGTPAAQPGGEHAGHAGGGGATAAGGLSADGVVAAAGGSGLDQNLVLTPPAEGAGWLVAENDARWPVHFDKAVVHPETGEVTGVSRYADWPLLAKLSALGIQAHMGFLFGLVNQLLLVALALGILCVIVWGYRMWWQRRPGGTRLAVGAPPARGAWRQVPRWQLALVLALAAAVGWALPLLGISLLGFLVLDAALQLARRRRAPA